MKNTGAEAEIVCVDKVALEDSAVNEKVTKYQSIPIGDSVNVLDQRQTDCSEAHLRRTFKGFVAGQLLLQECRLRSLYSFETIDVMVMPVIKSKPSDVWCEMAEQQESESPEFARIIIQFTYQQS